MQKLELLESGIRLGRKWGQCLEKRNEGFVDVMNECIVHGNISGTKTGYLRLKYEYELFEVRRGPRPGSEFLQPSRLKVTLSTFFLSKVHYCSPFFPSQLKFVHIT